MSDFATKEDLKEVKQDLKESIANLRTDSQSQRSDNRNDRNEIFHKLDEIKKGQDAINEKISQVKQNSLNTKMEIDKKISKYKEQNNKFKYKLIGIFTGIQGTIMIGTLLYSRYVLLAKQLEK